MLIDSHTKNDFKPTKKSTITSRTYFLFSQNIRKNNKSLEFEIQLKISYEKRFIIYANLGGYAVNMIISSLYVSIESPVSSIKQQQMFNESIRKVFTLACVSWVTDRKPVYTGCECKLDIEPASHVNYHFI